jgi:GNAT superfamily N-acetyltransferase
VSNGRATGSRPILTVTPVDGVGRRRARRGCLRGSSIVSVGFMSCLPGPTRRSVRPVGTRGRRTAIDLAGSTAARRCVRRDGRRRRARAESTRGQRPATPSRPAPLRGVGLSSHPDPHPYWAVNGALIYRDPDGREVVFAPWVYGRDPEPVDSQNQRPEPETSLRFEWYEGDREALRPLLIEAEDSARQLDLYINDGRVLVAWRGRQPVGHLQLVTSARGVVELKNMAVAEELRGIGIGRTLVTSALAMAARDGATRMLVATAAADVGNLRFYQRCGFRLASFERDAFTPKTGYPEQIMIGGIPLRDRVWLEQTLKG